MLETGVFRINTGILTEATEGICLSVQEDKRKKASIILAKSY